MESGVKVCSVYVVLVLLFATSVTSTPFRPDYQYDKRTRSYYKLHIETLPQFEAELVCSMEGSSLMVPSSEEDISVVHGMFKKYPDIGDVVLVGNDGKKHEPAEEKPVIDLSEDQSSENVPGDYSIDVITRSGEIETYPRYSRLPFVCKIEEKDVIHDDKCGINIKEYTFLETTGSCYRVPNFALTWVGAYDECKNEGAHLVVVNSEAESLALKGYIAHAPRATNSNAFYFFYAGFRAEKPSRLFKTIFNETLDAAGFNRWSEGEPNNHNDSEYCGTVFLNDGLFNDVSCLSKFSFICEKEVRS